MEQLAYKPNVLFAVSKRPASKSEILTFEKYNIEHRQSDTIADILILKILKEHKDYDNFIIISSDSDFCVFFDEIMNKNIQFEKIEIFPAICLGILLSKKYYSNKDFDL